MAVPEDRRYSQDHQWVQPDGDRAGDDGGDVCLIGLTDFAQEALGEVTLVQLCEIGTVVEAGAEMGEVEAFKAMSDLYMPVAATVVGWNPQLETDPRAVNDDPYGAGWLCKIRPQSLDDLGSLLDAAAYNELIGVG